MARAQTPDHLRALSPVGDGQLQQDRLAGQRWF